MSDVKPISTEGYTPEVMAQKVPWRDCERAMIVTMKKDGSFQFWISASSPAHICLMKAKMDQFFDDIVRVGFQVK